MGCLTKRNITAPPPGCTQYLSKIRRARQRAAEDGMSAKRT